MSKVSRKDFLWDFNKQFSKVNLPLWKKAVETLGRTAKLGKCYGIYLVLTKEMAQKWHL